MVLGIFTLPVTPVAYIGEETVNGMAATYAKITVAADGSIIVNQ